MMRKFNYLLIGALMSAFGLFVACSSSDDTTSNNGGGGNAPVTPVVPVDPTLTDAYLCGFVRNTQGEALSYVTVTTGSATTTTDQNGFFEFKRIKIVDGRVVVKLTRDGFADVVRSFEYKAGEAWDIVMTSTYSYSSVSAPSKQENFQSTEDKNIPVTNTGKTMEVDLKGAGYKNAATGEAYNGTVRATVTYLNPEDEENFADQMPGGDLAAIKTDEKGNKEEVQLISYGMTAVKLEASDGTKLQLTGGEKAAKLSFPIPDNIKQMRENDRPQFIPLWSFNEETGLWENEGKAELKGDVYEGEVHHFSWVNLDYPERRATVKGVVKDQAGKVIPYIKVYIGQTSAFTNDKGEYQAYIPKDTKVKVWIRSFDYGNYAEDESKLVFVNVPEQNAGDVYQADLILPLLGQITGNIENKGTGGNVATVWLEYNKDGHKYETKKIRSGENGSFTIQAPSGYTGAAYVRVSTSEGVTVTKEVQLTGGNVSAGTITIESNTSENGTITLKRQNGQVISVNIGAIDYYSKTGVIINGTNMEVELNTEMDWEKLETEGGYALHMHRIDIPNYDPTKTSYVIENFNTALMAVGKDQTGENWINFESFSINVTRSGNKFHFTIPENVGEMQVYNGDTGEGQAEPVTMSGSFTVDLYYEGEQATNVAPTDTRIPDFIKPILTETAPFAYIVKNSPKLGKGVNLAFSGDINTFNALKEKADQLGMKDYSADFGNNYESNKEAVYYSEGKLLKINYYQYGYSVQAPYSISSGYSPINIIALDGTIFYISDLQYFAKRQNPVDVWGDLSK